MLSNIVFNPALTISAGEYCKNVLTSAAWVVVVVGSPKLIEFLERQKKIADEQQRIQGGAPNLNEKSIDANPTKTSTTLNVMKMGFQVLIGGAWSPLTSIAAIFALNRALTTYESTKDLINCLPNSPTIIKLKDDIQDLQKHLNLAQSKNDNKEIKKTVAELAIKQAKLDKEMTVQDPNRLNHYESSFIPKIQAAVFSPFLCLGWAFATLGSMVEVTKGRLKDPARLLDGVHSSSEAHCCAELTDVSTLLQNTASMVSNSVSFIQSNPDKAIGAALIAYKAHSLGISAAYTLRLMWLKASSASQQTQATCLSQVVRHWGDFTTNLGRYAAIGAINDMVPELITTTIGTYTLAAMSTLGISSQYEAKSIGRIVLLTPVTLKTFYNLFKLGVFKKKEHGIELAKTVSMVGGLTGMYYLPPKIVNILPNIVSTPFVWGAQAVSGIISFFARQTLTELKNVSVGMDFTASLLREGLDCATLRFAVQKVFACNY